MDYGPHDNIEEEKADRLSNLTDDLIHKIFSFVSINDTVKTMALSSRYRFIWTTMPYLNFDTEDFPRLQNFVDCFLKRRNNQIDVSSLDLDIEMREFTEPSVQELVHYAFSHNIQRIEVTYRDPDWIDNFDLIEFPLSLFSSSLSLKHLSLSNGSSINGLKLEAMSILELPALTTLYLEGVTFCSDDANCCVITGLFSKCTNLKNLTLIRCSTVDKSSLSICHPGLSNLTLDDIESYDVVKVVAPQLENLTITYDKFSDKLEHVISAPNLASLAYRGRYPLHLSTNGFHSLKEADIRVLAYRRLDVDDARQMVGLLQQLHNVKFLKLNLESIEHLSEYVELISHQPSPFVNLESLTIYPENLDDLEENLDDLEENLDDSESRSRPKGKVNLSTQLVTNYLLDSSPGASLTMFYREEIIADRDLASAQKLMAELRVLLEQEKANIKTYDRANTNRSGKAPFDEGDINVKVQFQIRGNKYALIESCWNDSIMERNQRETTACGIIYKLKSIEDVLRRELPPTQGAMIQACFSSLCAEADTIIRKIMKKCDEHQSRLSACFQEFATGTITMEPSSV